MPLVDVDLLLKSRQTKTDDRWTEIGDRTLVVVEIYLCGVVVHTAATPLRLNAVAIVICTTMVTTATTVVRLKVVTALAVAHNNREHTATTCHKIYGKQQRRYNPLEFHTTPLTRTPGVLQPTVRHRLRLQMPQPRSYLTES